MPGGLSFWLFLDQAHISEEGTMSHTKIKGRIKWFNSRKGYGFIARDDGQGDVFVHRSAIRNIDPLWIREGDAVEFFVEQDPRGPRAIEVEVTTRGDRPPLHPRTGGRYT